jgi:hypothetical protein
MGRKPMETFQMTKHLATEQDATGKTNTHTASVG